jgi:hypothetical protein
MTPITLEAGREYQLQFNGADLVEIHKALHELPKRIADPILERMCSQLIRSEQGSDRLETNPQR